MPAGLAIAFALGFCGLFTALAVLVGPKATNPDKLKPFECGSEPIGTPRGRYSVRFYQVAILFLVFDIEADQFDLDRYRHRLRGSPPAHARHRFF